MAQIKKLQWLCMPENWKSESARFQNEAMYIDLTNSIAEKCTDCHGLGCYGDYIYRSGEAIDRNALHADELDLNTCVQP